jgi:hypothetical protein
VHRKEVDARRDAPVQERALVVVARRSGASRIDADDVEMAGVLVAWVASERLDAGEISEPLVVEGELPPARFVVLIQLLELSERDRGETSVTRLQQGATWS